jgi:protein TonB
VQEAPAAEEAVPHPPAEAVDARRALFASVKEHRSELLRAAATTAAVEQREYPPASLPAANLQPEGAPLQVTLPKSQPVIAPLPAAMPAPSQNRLLVGGAIGALIVVVGGFFLWPKTQRPKQPSVVAAAPKERAPLQVLAEPLGKGLVNVRWNAQSSAIAQARDGRLVITEHDKAPRVIALDSEQLKIGHLTYQATAESIEFDLEVNDRSGAVAKESILALSPPAAAAAQAPREQAATVKSQSVSVPAPANVQTPVPAVLAPAVVAAQASPAKARAFIPPPTQQTAEERAVIDAPPALANAPATPLGVSLPPALGTVSPPPAGAPQPVRVESNLQAGNLLKRVVPVYPPLARSAGVQGVVRFTAVIGKDGKIQNLKLISGPSPLVDAASSAVKQWVYRPTLLNGQPVEVVTEINVNFTISGSGR